MVPLLQERYRLDANLVGVLQELEMLYQFFDRFDAGDYENVKAVYENVSGQFAMGFLSEKANFRSKTRPCRLPHIPRTHLICRHVAWLLMCS